jgi:HK97 family phage portal protein
MRTVFGGLAELVAKSPVPYTPTGGMRGAIGSALTRGSRGAQLAAMESVSTMFSIASLLAEATAAVDWSLYRTHDGRGKVRGEEPREVTDHLALRVWNQPNAFMSRQAYVETVQQHIDLVGEGWGVLGFYDAGMTMPREIWPARPDMMNVVPDPDEFIAGYWYASPDGTQVPLTTTEVLRITMPNPRDPFRGMGPVQSLMADLDGIRYSAEWNRNFFLNSAEPGGIVEFPRNLSDPEFKKFVARWNEQHKGVSKAHRVAVLENGKWVSNSFSQKDMQFVELQDVSRDKVREAYRVHKHMLGQSDDVNRANAAAADYTFAKRLVVARLERWKGMLNGQFLPRFGATGAGVYFDYHNPVPEDEELENATLTARTGAFKTLIDAGVDPAAAAEACDLPPLLMRAAAALPAPQPDPVQALAERITNLLAIGAGA